MQRESASNCQYLIGPSAHGYWNASALEKSKSVFIFLTFGCGVHPPSVYMSRTSSRMPRISI